MRKLKYMTFTGSLIIAVSLASPPESIAGIKARIDSADCVGGYTRYIFSWDTDWWSRRALYFAGHGKNTTIGSVSGNWKPWRSGAYYRAYSLCLNAGDGDNTYQFNAVIACTLSNGNPFQGGTACQEMVQSNVVAMPKVPCGGVSQ